MEIKRSIFVMVLIGCFSITAATDYTHLIMYGQSLSTGHDSGVTLSSENLQGNYMIGNQIWINYGNSNVQAFNPLVGKPSVSVSDIIECPLLGAANHIRRKELADNIVATSAGTSGRTLEELSKESQVSDYYQDYIKALRMANQICKRERCAMNCPAIFFMQGEWNYLGYESGLTPGSKPTFDKDEYKSLLVKLKNNMQEDVKKEYNQNNTPVFYTYQTGAQYTVGKQLTIGMAQLEASNECDDIICAGPVYPMTDVGGHLDANGYRWYGEMLGKVYYKTQVLGENFKPLQPKMIERDASNDKKLLVRFAVPVPPLVLDGQTTERMLNYGFEVWLNNQRQTISTVKIVDGDAVELTCTRSLTGNVEIIYGSKNTDGHGNLRDSDDYPAAFNYEDLDKKDQADNYIYPRAGNKSLRPRFEPKDESGEVIYGKLYPLYNFSVAFYYVLSADQDKLEVLLLNYMSASSPKKKKNDIYFISGDKKLQIISTSEEHNCKIYDMTGYMVRNFETSRQKEYSLLILSPGIYFAEVRSGTERITKKIIVD